MQNRNGGIRKAMIYTSYFAKMKKMPGNFYPVAVCQYPPKWYEGPVLRELAPTPSILWEYKNSNEPKDHKEERYTERFRSEVLSKLDVSKVVSSLVGTLPFEALAALNEEGVPVWESKKVHIVMLCFEKTGDFCHRYEVAEHIADGLSKLVRNEVKIGEAVDGDFVGSMQRLNADNHNEKEEDMDR